MTDEMPNITLQRASIHTSLSGDLAMFIGISGKDYVSFLEDHEVNVGAFTGTGNETSTACGRLAFLFDATGAAVTIDTACSSSLVAVNIALRQTNIYHKSEEFAANSGHQPDDNATNAFDTWSCRDAWRQMVDKTLDVAADGYGCRSQVVLYFFKTKMIKA